MKPDIVLKIIASTWCLLMVVSVWMFVTTMVGLAQQYSMRLAGSAGAGLQNTILTTQ